MERAVILASGPVIRPRDVLLGPPGEEPARHPSLDGTLDETIERWARAAADLGIPLRRLAKLLGPGLRQG